MTQLDDAVIRRRPDGSIDTDFYAHRAARLRRAAMRKMPALWRGCLGRATAMLAGSARMPPVFGSGFGRPVGGR